MTDTLAPAAGPTLKGQGGAAGPRRRLRQPPDHHHRAAQRPAGRAGPWRRHPAARPRIPAYAGGVFTVLEELVVEQPAALVVNNISMRITPMHAITWGRRPLP